LPIFEVSESEWVCDGCQFAYRPAEIDRIQVDGQSNFRWKQKKNADLSVLGLGDWEIAWFRRNRQLFLLSGSSMFAKINREWRIDIMKFS
jgi:hypothetical protein